MHALHHMLSEAPKMKAPSWGKGTSPICWVTFSSRLPLLAALCRCALRDTPQLPSPRHRCLGRAHSQKLLGWGGGLNLMVLASSSMHWQELLRAPAVIFSIPDVLTILEAPLVSDSELNRKRKKYIRFIYRFYIRIVFPVMQLLSSKTETSTLQYTKILFQSCGGTDMRWGVWRGWDTARREQLGCPSKLIHLHSPWPIFCVFLFRSIFSHVFTLCLLLAGLSNDFLQFTSVCTRTYTGLPVSPQHC